MPVFRPRRKFKKEKRKEKEKKCVAGHCCFVACEAQSRWARGITPSLVTVETVTGPAPRHVIGVNLKFMGGEVTFGHSTVSQFILRV